MAAYLHGSRAIHFGNSLNSKYSFYEKAAAYSSTYLLRGACRLRPGPQDR
jgi:hypothetical protein